jgi:hypothetical protein
MKFRSILAGTILGCAAQYAWAAEAAANAAAQANNPLANMTAVNLQQYFIGELTGK